MILVENLESRVLFSVGALTHGFGTAGQIDTPAGQNNELIAVQSNGSFIVAGSAQNADLTTHGFLERYHANGRVDSGFGDQGRLDLSSTQFADVLSLSFSSTGKIVIIGTDGNGNDVLEQFTSSGKADAHFGTAGIAEMPTGATSPVAKVARNGDVVVGANYALSSTTSPVGVFLRYTRKGQPDTHFGVNGAAITNAGVGFTSGDFFITKTGQIDALFYSPSSDTMTNPTTMVVTNGPFTALELFDSNGHLDLSFNQNEGLNIPGTNYNRFLSTGYILSTGSAADGATTTTLYYPYGTVDALTFAKKQSGVATLPFPANAGTSTDRTVIEPGDKILIVEDGTTSTPPYIALGGLNKNGTVDHRFHHTGVVEISPVQKIIAAAGDGSHVILLENPGAGQPQQILEYSL